VVIDLPTLDQADDGVFDEVLRTLLWEKRLLGQPELERQIEVLRCKGLLKTTDGRSWGQFIVLAEPKSKC